MEYRCNDCSKEYKYDDKLGYFIAGNKNEICSDLINNRVMDIEAIYDEL